MGGAAPFAKATRAVSETTSFVRVEGRRWKRSPYGLERSTASTVLVVDADLRTREGVAKLVDATSGLDVGLFAAAAGFGTSGNFLDGTREDELYMIDVNCRAVAELTHTFGRRLAERGKGGIVLFSSLVAFQGVPRAANYAATKAYVQSFAEALAIELAPAGIDVVASAPGPVNSGFASRARMIMGIAPALGDALRYEGSDFARSSETTITAPGEVTSARTLPPAAWASWRAMERPRPLPSE